VTVSKALVSAIAAACLAEPVRAQLSGVPAWPLGVPNPNYPGAVYLTAHTTSGEDFLGSTAAETGVTLAGRWSLASKAALSGGLGFARRDVAAGDRATRLHYFVAAAVTPLRDRHAVRPIEYTVSLVSGFGSHSLPGRLEEHNIPVGVSASLSLGMDGWFVEPWIEPRWHWRRTALDTGAGWQNGIGGTTGVAFAWSKWSLLIAVDYLNLGARTGAGPALPQTRVVSGSAGVQYAF
jgi:hypothetical protein